MIFEQLSIWRRLEGLGTFSVNSMVTLVESPQASVAVKTIFVVMELQIKVPGGMLCVMVAIPPVALVAVTSEV